MPRFAYQARDASGQMDAGAVNAASADEAFQMLRQAGKAVLDIREEQQAGGVEAALMVPSARVKVRQDQVIFFATQLAVMVDTGVPLSESLDCIAEQASNPTMRAVVADISQEVKAGTEFSKTLEKYPRIFSRLFIALIKASEASGTMGQMLQRASQYMQQQRETRRRVAGAMVYPACMLGFSMLVVLSLLIFILPRFQKIYAAKDAVLPAPTRVLLGISGIVTMFWPLLVIGTIGAGVGLYLFGRTPTGGRTFDWIRIHLPILGGMYRKSYLARSLRTMATMVSTGVSMLEGLSITSEVSGNCYYAAIWSEIGERIKEGSTLSEHLFECELVPRSVSQMVSAGEKTGKLSVVMNRLAEFCEEDLQVAVRTATTMIEPLMIIFMGLLIGGIAVALLLPVFSISKVVAN